MTPHPHKPRPHGTLPAWLSALSGLPAAWKKRKATTTLTPAPKAPTLRTAAAPRPTASLSLSTPPKPTATTTERERCARIVRHGLQQAIEARGDLAPLVAATYWAFETDLAADAAVDALNARAAVAGLHRNHHHLAARRG